MAELDNDNKLLQNTEWNEGWQIVPWGIYANCINRQEWTLLNLQARRWRPLKFGVEIEGLIPFQNVLTQGGTRESVSSFSNRPNMHIFVDDGHILPSDRKWQMDEIAHNDEWSATSLPFSRSKLKSPKFNFYNLLPSQWQNIRAALPPANQPQKLLSLYNTGRVQAMYAGQKFKREHRVMNAQWRGMRGTNDMLKYCQPSGSLAGLSSAANLEVMNHGIECYGGEQGIIESPASSGHFYTANPSQPSNTSEQTDERGSHYADTNNPLPTYAPPYILVKMETYHQPDDTPIDIFAQMHINYYCEIELEEMDLVGNSYDPTSYYPLGQGSANNPLLADQILAEACYVGPMDNRLGRIYTAGTNSMYYG